MSARVDFVVMKESGGKWLYELDLLAAQPEVDDIILVEAEVGRQASVQFRLTNQFSTYAPFDAYFTCTFLCVYVM